MGDIFFVIIVVYLVIMVFISIFSSRTRVNSNAQGRRRPVSSDGHEVPRAQDLTCETKYGHVHNRLPEYERTPRYIVHEDPEEGYVVLNGIKRKISDCKYL